MKKPVKKTIFEVPIKQHTIRVIYNKKALSKLLKDVKERKGNNGNTF